MKKTIPDSWLILGAILGPATIATATGSGGHVLFILGIGAGAICGLSLFVRLRGNGRRSGETFAISSVFGLISSIASLAAFGACSTDLNSGNTSLSLPTPAIPQIEMGKDEGLIAASKCHVLTVSGQTETDGWLHLTNLRLLVRTAEGERSIPLERIESMKKERDRDVITISGEDPLTFRSADHSFVRRFETISRKTSDFQ